MAQGKPFVPAQAHRQDTQIFFPCCSPQFFHLCRRPVQPRQPRIRGIDTEFYGIVSGSFRIPEHRSEISRPEGFFINTEYRQFFLHPRFLSFRFLLIFLRFLLQCIISHYVLQEKD